MNCQCKKCEAAERAVELRVAIDALRSRGEEVPGVLLDEMKWCVNIILGGITWNT